MILIDGYNLLYAAGVFAEGERAGTLQAEREALLQMLATRLTAKQRRVTTIVFDASGAPPGLPDAASYESIKVRYARGYEDADALLEEIIEKCRAPRSLSVVSSDHRVQRAARSRGAAWIDSERWLRSLPRPRDEREQEGSSNSAGIGDSAYWAAQFNDAETRETIERAEAEDLRRKAFRPKVSPPSAEPKQEATKNRPERRPFGEGIFEGFPPHYGEDLLDP